MGYISEMAIFLMLFFKQFTHPFAVFGIHFLATSLELIVRIGITITFLLPSQFGRSGGFFGILTDSLDHGSWHLMPQQ